VTIHTAYRETSLLKNSILDPENALIAFNKIIPQPIISCHQNRKGPREAEL